MLQNMQIREAHVYILCDKIREMNNYDNPNCSSHDYSLTRIRNSGLTTKIVATSLTVLEKCRKQYLGVATR